MKKVLTLVFMGALFFTACKENSSSNQNETENVEVAKSEFYCPMKCEGEKTYAEEGQCPECEMDLVVVENE
jgi:Cu2+-exporting ATPase